MSNTADQKQDFMAAAVGAAFPDDVQQIYKAALNSQNSELYVRCAQVAAINRQAHAIAAQTAVLMATQHGGIIPSKGTEVLMKWAVSELEKAVGAQIAVRAPDESGQI